MNNGELRKDDAKATEYLCLSENRKKVCVGWDGRKASILVCLEGYTVSLPPNDQIIIGDTVMGNTDINTTLVISAQQARDLAKWINDNIPAKCPR